MVERCARWPACSEHRDLADVLGHDEEGHRSLNALTHARITSVTELGELPDEDLLDVRNLGPVRIARIRRRLAARPRTGGKGDRP